MGPLAPLDWEALALRATTGDTEATATLRSLLLHSDRESANRAAESVASLDDAFVRSVFTVMEDAGGAQDVMVWLLLVRSRRGLPIDWALRWLERVGQNPGDVPSNVRNALLRWLVEFGVDGIGPAEAMEHALRCDDDTVALGAAQLLVERSFADDVLLERLRRVRGVASGRAALLRHRIGDPLAADLLVGLVASESPWALEAVRCLRVDGRVPTRLQRMLRPSEPTEVRARLAGWMAACGDKAALDLLRQWSHARSLHLMLCARAELLVCGTDTERTAILQWVHSQPQRMVEKLLDAIDVIDDTAAAQLSRAAAGGHLGAAGARVAAVLNRAIRCPCGRAVSGAE